MRSIVLMLLLAAHAATAQPAAEPESPLCNVVARPPDLNEAGEFVRPPPTPDECLFAGDLVQKLLGANRRGFRMTTNFRQLPGSLRPEIGADAMAQPIVTWESDELIVVAYRSSDVTGPVTNVIVADKTVGAVCRYPRFPTSKSPRSLSLAEIQDVLDAGLAGERETPTCYLREIPVEQTDAP